MDGGQIARELLLLHNHHNGIVASLWLSTVTGAAVAVFVLVNHRSLFMALMFGYLAYTSYATLQAYRGHSAGPDW